MYIRSFVCSPALATSFHTSIGYDNTSNKVAFQRDRVKVKVAVTIFRKTLSSL